MSELPCDCCGTTESTTDGAETRTRWLAERPVTRAPLPADLAAATGDVLGRGPVETLGAFAAAVRETAGDGALAAADLCHTRAETPHRAATADEEHRFLCFFDGVVLTHLADEPVTVRTESPAGERVELVATPDGDVDVTPDEAVMSFGVAADADAIDGATAEEAAICPYVQAFPTRAAYEYWAAGMDAPTVGMPLAAGVAFAEALAR